MLWIEIQKSIAPATTKSVHGFFINLGGLEIYANYDINKESYITLGTYATPERTLEVYNEMQMLLKDPFTELHNAECETITLAVPWQFYKMPEE